MKRVMRVFGVIGVLCLVSCGQETEESKVFGKFKKGDESARAGAISKMAAMKGQESKVVPYLVQGLGDESAKVRLAAVQALSVVDGAFAKASAKVAKLAKGDSDPQVKAAALESLVSLGSGSGDVAEDVASILGGDDLQAALSAASVLGAHAGTPAVPYKALASVMSTAIKVGEKDDQVSVCVTVLASLVAAGTGAADALPVLDACVAEPNVDPGVKNYLQLLAKVIRGTEAADKLSEAMNELTQ